MRIVRHFGFEVRSFYLGRTETRQRPPHQDQKKYEPTHKPTQSHSARWRNQQDRRTARQLYPLDHTKTSTSTALDFVRREGCSGSSTSQWLASQPQSQLRRSERARSDKQGRAGMVKVVGMWDEWMGVVAQRQNYWVWLWKDMNSVRGGLIDMM